MLKIMGKLSEIKMFLQTWWLFHLLILITVFFINAEDYNNYDEEVTTETTTVDYNDDEWRMDFIPTGYLPDNVYKELGWYSIIQLQPLIMNIKNIMVARQIWEHTLSRPHVIMETMSLPTVSKISRKQLADEGAQWSREERTKQEILLEMLKLGGNGLTVRTVVSSSNKTMFMVYGGKYFRCPYGSEPDLSGIKNQGNLHEPKCTHDKEPEPLEYGVDPCIDAENILPEYSYPSGWALCLGPGDRDAAHHLNGSLNCGKKLTVTFTEFLSLCAIDFNVVITIDYFGDEPRKDIIKNSTLCMTYDPCHVSYLYRMEPPSTPSYPVSRFTTPDPCDTTLCPECVDEGTVEPGLLITIPKDGHIG